MRKNLYLFILSVPVILLFFFIYYNKSSHSNLKIISINNHKIKVEVADTDILREKGLSGRVHLTQNTGMLFIFPSSGSHYFWMKNMLFPLDFVWINDDTIVDLTENVAVIENGKDKVVPSFTSRIPADKILEVNSGMIKSLKISIGDKLEYE